MPQKYFNKKIPKTYNLGFTLLETMIACMLGMVLCGVIMQNYLSNKNIYNLNTKIARLNENLQITDFFLRQAVIHAGFTGCRNIPELNIYNHTNLHFDFTRPIKSYTADNNSDVLVIIKANTAIIGINKDVEKSTTAIKVTKNPAIEGNTFLLLSDCQNADLFSINDYDSKQTINLIHTLENNYSVESAVVGRFEEMTFFIAKTARLNNKNKPIYSLFLSTNHKHKEELIPGITNMRINYEINNNTAQNLTAEQLNNLNLWHRITALRIILTPQEQLVGVKAWNIYIKLHQKN